MRSSRRKAQRLALPVCRSLLYHRCCPPSLSSYSNALAAAILTTAALCCCRPSSRCGGSSCRQRFLWACRRRRRRPPLWRSWSCTPRSSPLNRLQRRQRRWRRRRRRRHQHQHQHQRQWRQCNMPAATQHSQQQHQLARRLCLSLKQVPTTPKTPPATHDRRPREGCCTSLGVPVFLAAHTFRCRIVAHNVKKEG